MMKWLVVAGAVTLAMAVVGCSGSDTSTRDAVVDEDSVWEPEPAFETAGTPKPAMGQEFADKVGCTNFIADMTGGVCQLDHGELTMYFYVDAADARDTFATMCESPVAELLLAGNKWIVIVDSTQDMDTVASAVMGASCD